MTHILIEREVVERAVQSIAGLLEWCKAVPADTPLPEMPGIDGDLTAEALAALRAALQAAPATEQKLEEVHGELMGMVDEYGRMKWSAGLCSGTGNLEREGAFNKDNQAARAALSTRLRSILSGVESSPSHSTRATADADAQSRAVRKLPDAGERVETGPVQFGDDWPGVFIRGDNAFHFCMCLDRLMEDPTDPFARLAIDGLRNTLSGADLTGISKRASPNEKRSSLPPSVGEAGGVPGSEGGAIE